MSLKPAERLWFDHALLPGGWASGVTISLEDGLISAVTADTPPPAGANRGRSVLPGLPNLHSHAFQRAMSGLTETRGEGRDSFWSWRDLLYRFVERLTPVDIRAVTAMAYAEMLEGGFTRVCEFHYIHNDADGTRYSDPAEMAGQVIGAAEEAGIGLSLLPVFYAHSGFGGEPPLTSQRRFVSGIDPFCHLMDAAQVHGAALTDMVLGIAPHSLRAVTPEELKSLTARYKTGPVHIHIAEQVKEVEDCLAWSGARPVEWLLQNADVDARWCLVHATHAGEAELRGIARSGAVAGLCPVTEANLGDGIFDAQTFLTHGGRLGIGSDSNVSINAADELRILEYSQRFKHLSRNVIAGEGHASTGRSLFELALAGGHQASGTRGCIEAGAPADLIALDSAALPEAAAGGDRLLDAWIFRNVAGAVTDVWRRGAHVVQGGRHVRRGDIEARYRAALARLLG